MLNAADQHTKCMRSVGLKKSYGAITVVRDISLDVRRGEMVAILGPNGAGKTTLMSMMTGIVKADAGQIEIDGVDATKLPMYARAQLGLSYLPQEPSVFRGLSVEDNILMGLETSQPDKASRMKVLNLILEEFQLSDHRKQIAAKLSGGLRRRCEVARSLASNPKYLMLDEPFAGVDPLAISDLQSTISRIRDFGLGVLISDHNVMDSVTKKNSSPYFSR